MPEKKENKFNQIKLILCVFLLTFSTKEDHLDLNHIYGYSLHECMCLLGINEWAQCIINI